MTTQPAMPMGPALLTVAEPTHARKKLAIAGLSLTGILLFAMGVLVIGSGYRQLRPVMMGLAMHPYLVPVALAFPLVVMSRIHLFPLRILASLFVFVGMYAFSALNGGVNPLAEVFKITCAAATIVACALLVRRRGDFVAGVLGLTIAVAGLGLRGLQPAQAAAGEIMDGANKNSYSIFALPALLLAGFVVLHMKTVPVYIKAILISCTLPALGVIFMGGNRSGYVGAVLVGLMLFWDQRGKGLVLVGAIAAVVAIGILQFGRTDVLNERLKQTVEGNKSDTLRRDIIIACVEIAMENPIIGVGPKALPREIARHAPSYNAGAIESHNVFAHVLGGSGIICFGALLALGWSMSAFKPRAGGKIGGPEDPLREALRLMRMMVILWVVRGLFTPEIMYNPSFNIALGLVIGFCMLTDAAGETERLAAWRALPAQSNPGQLATGF